MPGRSAHRLLRAVRPPRRHRRGGRVAPRRRTSFFAKRDKSPSWAEPGRPFLFSIEGPSGPVERSRQELVRREERQGCVRTRVHAPLPRPPPRRTSSCSGRLSCAPSLRYAQLRRRTPPPAAGAIVGVAADFRALRVTQPAWARGRRRTRHARGTRRARAKTKSRRDARASGRRSYVVVVVVVVIVVVVVVVVVVERRTTQAGTSTTRPGLTRRTTTPTVDRRHPLPRPRVRKRKARWRACRTKGEAAEGGGRGGGGGRRAAASAPRAAPATGPRTSVGRRARAAAVGDTSPKADRIDRDSLKRFVLGVIRVQVQSYRSDTSPSSAASRTTPNRR